jgi:hypothetical protein
MPSLLWPEGPFAEPWHAGFARWACFGAGVGVGFGVGRTVARGVGVGIGVGRAVGRGVGPGVGRDSGPELDPPDVRGGVTPGGGVAVAPSTAPAGVGLGLAGAGLSVAVGAVGGAAGDGGAITGDVDAVLDGVTADGVSPLAAGVAAGDAAPVWGAVDDGRTAVSPPMGGDVVGPPNAPSASAIAASVRFRIPRATTSRARWAIATNDRDSSSGRGTRRLKETASRPRSYNAGPDERPSARQRMHQADRALLSGAS